MTAEEQDRSAASGIDPQFERLLEFLKDERGFDFTGYKRASLVRRVQRRMEELRLQDLEEFQDHLVLHPEEFTALFNTILINVTGFLRDRDAWTYLEQSVLPAILAKREGQPIRAWSAGCASGEEAYSLAMVLAEVMGMEEFRTRVKIYATDVDEDALTTARQALYTEREISGVPPELREKYFERQGQRFAVSKELRRAVIFGRNDLVQDAPISHVDVLLCRNTLMYFNAQTQSQILRRMHFALRPEGVLFLGKAEMLLTHTSMFRPLELKRRFFTKVAVEARDRRAVVRAATQLVDDDPMGGERVRLSALLAAPQAQILLDHEGRLALSTNRAMHLFNVSVRDLGKPIQDLEVSYRPIELRAHIEEATTERRQVWVRDVTWVRGSAEPLTFDIQVTPLRDEGGTLLGTSIVFNDVTQYRQLQTELEFANRQLETAYEELQSTNEELETTNEELQSTVEELETTNEELQSTNEELETMNEELQSMNDELQMSSEAQREQQEHYYRLSRFMTSVLGSMRSGVAVVDDQLKVVAWNAKAEDLWGVRMDEAEGVHLASLDIGLPLVELVQPLRQKISSDDADHEVITLEAVNRRGRHVTVQVTITRLSREGDAPSGALLMMDVVDAAPS
jgi:two-component system, chemotaxis family, CheB/CheR fusion protein